MEISKEDQERMEKEAECYSSSFKVNQDLPALKDLAKHDYWQGIFHEHLTQVLPLRKQIEEKDKEIERLRGILCDAGKLLKRAESQREIEGPSTFWNDRYTIMEQIDTLLKTKQP
jgi:hypothetical protein